MLINFTDAKNAKKEVTKNLKKINESSVIIKLFFADDGIGKMEVSASTNGSHVYHEFKVTYNFTYQYGYNTDKLVIDTTTDNAVFDYLFTDEYSIELYPKNLNNIHITNVDCHYWIDTIVLKKHNSLYKIKHDQMCFAGIQMIYNK